MPPARPPRSANAAFNEIRRVLALDWTPIPEEGFGGNAAPGRMLEHLLGIDENNADSPDLKDWEVKFHGGSALLTLFHKEPEPQGTINTIVTTYGWPDRQGRTSFRHTLGGTSARGFSVHCVNGGDIIVQHSGATIATWPRNSLLNAIAAKLRRLIVVRGRLQHKPVKRVKYNSAKALWDINLDEFCRALEDGRIKIDFDARTNGGAGSSIRNHGTKFRVHLNDLVSIYDHSQDIELPTVGVVAP